MRVLVVELSRRTNLNFITFTVNASLLVFNIQYYIHLSLNDGLNLLQSCNSVANCAQALLTINLSRSRQKIFMRLKELADIQVLFKCRRHNIGNNALNVSMSRAVMVSISANKKRSSGFNAQKFEGSLFTSLLVNCWNSTQGVW